VIAAALISDAHHRVLLVRPASGPDRWWLPAVTELSDEETPRQAGARAVHQQVGLVPRLGDMLICEWAGAALYVFDGGRISARAAKRLAVTARASSRLVAIADLAALMSAADRRRIVAALEARAEGRSHYLEAGEPAAAPAAMRRFGIAPALQSGAAWTWHGQPVPSHLPIQQAWVWVFAPDGRVVVYVDQDGLIGLPGGTLEDHEYRDPQAAAVREVREETQLEITEPRYLGYVLDEQPGGRTVARVRMAAAITAVGPAAPDPATGTTHRRLLVPPGLVAELCGWGQTADRQTEAALAVAASLGISGADPAAGISEISPAGLSLDCLAGAPHQARRLD